MRRYLLHLLEIGFGVFGARRGHVERRGGRAGEGGMFGFEDLYRLLRVAGSAFIFTCFQGSIFGGAG